jgi:hypothetical protein
MSGPNPASAGNTLGTTIESDYLSKKDVPGGMYQQRLHYKDGYLRANHVPSPGQHHFKAKLLK